MRKRPIQLVLLAAICFLLPLGISAQSEDQIEWLSWEEAMVKMEQEPRKLLVNVYTQWCNWCRRMDKKTLEHPEIARYINAHFYAVKFDAEQKQELTYQGQVYKYSKSGTRGYHELAALLLRGRLSYPTFVFLDEEQEMIQSIVGYKTPSQFETIATYFGEDQYMHTPWSSYQRTYQASVEDDKN
jgi:thioredoxin-related protein